MLPCEQLLQRAPRGRALPCRSKRGIARGSPIRRFVCREAPELIQEQNLGSPREKVALTVRPSASRPIHCPKRYRPQSSSQGSYRFVYLGHWGRLDGETWTPKAGRVYNRTSREACTRRSRTGPATTHASETLLGGNGSCVRGHVESLEASTAAPTPPGLVAQGSAARFGRPVRPPGSSHGLPFLKRGSLGFPARCVAAMGSTPVWQVVRRICSVWALAALVATAAPQAARAMAGSSDLPPALFDTLEFRGVSGGGWYDFPAKVGETLDLLARCARSPARCPNRDILALLDELAGLPTEDPHDLLTAVNRLANRRPYRSDLANFDVREYWASPLEFLARVRRLRGLGDLQVCPAAVSRPARPLAAGRAAEAQSGRSRPRGRGRLPRRSGLYPGQLRRPGAAAERSHRLPGRLLLQ